LLALADYHFVIEKGQVVWRGDSATLKAAPEICHKYLGA
jgi:branched-chain amino acid transport system ATP-binding protein